MVIKPRIDWQRLSIGLFMAFSCLLATGCASMIAETIIEKTSGKEVLLFTQARYGELEQYMEAKMSHQATISPTDRFLLCTAYAKVKRYNKLFACLDQSEQHASDDRGRSSFNLTPEAIKAFSAVQRAEALIDLGEYSRGMQESTRGYGLSKSITGYYSDATTASLLTYLKLQTLSIMGLSQALNGEREAARNSALLLDEVPLNPTAKSLVSIRSVGVARIYAALGDYQAALDAIMRYEGSGALKITENLTNLLAGFGTGIGGNRLFNFFELPRYVMKCKLLLENNRTEEAREGYDSLLKLPMIEENGGLYWLILFDRGRIAERDGDVKGAIAFYRRAIEVIENQRSSINTESSKIGFVGDKQGVYRRLIDSLHADRQYATAFEYVERSKARALVDLLATQKDFAVQSGEDRQVRELLAEGSKLEEESLAQDARPEASRTRGLAIKAREQLRETSPELASLVTVSAPSAEEIQRLIREDENLVEYYYDRKNLYAFVLDRRGLKSIRLDASNLEDEVREYRKALASPLTGSHLEHAGRLYQRLIRPVEGFINTGKLILVAHGALHYLPFAALHDGKSYLVERYSIRMLPSASVIKYLGATTPEHPLDILVLGNPDLGDPRHDLAYAQDESIAIAKLYARSKVLLRKEATEKAFERIARNFRYIHFAAHGEFDADTPLRSALLLAREGENDGRLTLGRLYAMKLNVELVTLSACETGLGKIANGDDVVGLTRGFLYAGTRSIVASLWKVDDLATSRLMISFYTLLGSMDTREALRSAQLETMKRHPHPYYWGAFQLVGNAN